MLSDKQEQVVLRAYENGAVYVDAVVPNIYNHQPAASTALNKLAEQGFLEKTEAESNNSAHFIYFIDQKGEVYIENFLDR